ncbi:MAG: hypothetical protein LUC43_03495, partial [Burkholderiales bacterium]|nr:hypothetical protein [Burkholderiales bacterium]
DLEAAIANVIHILEDKKVAYLDLCDQIAFGIGKNGRPLYEEEKLKDCDFEGWEAASWSYKIYNTKDAHSLDGDDILRIIGWARHT